MSNLDKAVEVLREAYREPSMSPVHACGIMADALQAAGLLMPDLPEANDPRIFVPVGKGWRMGYVSVWTAPDSPVMVQNVEPGSLSPASSRQLAYALLAAADYAEKEQGNGSN